MIHRLVPILFKLLTRSARIGAVLWGGIGLAHAQASPPLESIQLTQQAYLDLVLTQNSTLRQQKLESLISQEGVQGARSLFEPKLVLETMKEHGFELNDTEAEAQREYKTEYEFDDVTYSAAIKGLLPLGTQYRLFYDLRDPSNSLQPTDKYGREWTARTGIELTQPLLKNFGISTNTAAIDIAEKEFAISQEQLSRTRMITAYQALVSYAALQQAQQAAAMEKNMLQLESQRIELMHALAEEGRVTTALMHLTRSQKMRREARLSASLKQLRRISAEVRRLLIGSDEPRLVNVIAADPETPLATANRPEPELLDNLVQQRPELKQATLATGQEATRLEYAKNQSLYELNLVLKAGKSGLSENFSSANDEIDGVHNFWTIGAVFTVPLGNSEAKSKVAAASLRHRQAMHKARSLEMLMRDEIIAAYDNVNQSYQEAIHFQESVNFLRAAHRENTLLSKEGRVSPLDLLSSELELIEAERLLSEKVYENRRAYLEIMLAEGRILELSQQN